MIVKSPYSFLIKHFKKIHVGLLFFCLYVYYKTMQTYSFVKDFVQLGSYDSSIENIAGKVTILSIVFIILVILACGLIILLLKRKNKPWKLYLIVVINYFILLITFLSVRGYFSSYSIASSMGSIRFMRDLLLICTFPQYAFFIVLGIRILGVDLKNFNFSRDQEFLELEDKDRQEFDLSINIDKHSFIRVYRRLKRNINYFYQEHKMPVNIVFSVVMVLVLFKIYQFVFITHKAYNEGENLDSSGYTIVINDSYITDKDYKGDVIDKNYNFIILNVTIKNNSIRRKINFNRFHIMNKTKNYSPTSKTYETYFNDYGVAYDDKTIDKGESFNTLLIYKVDKKLEKDKYVLYYQEFNRKKGNYLRKIKIKLNDVSKIKKAEKVDFGDLVDININGEEEEIGFEELEVVDSVDYKVKDCSNGSCVLVDKSYSATNGKILKLEFVSNGVDGKEMIDFLNKYGKIIYIDNNQDQIVGIDSAVGGNYFGKYVYIKANDIMANSEKISIKLIVRNNSYLFNIK